MASVVAEDERVDGDADDSPDDSAVVTSTYTVHRLRDLDRRGRWIVAAFVAALVLGPLLSFIRYLPEWVPSGDPAYMGLRALDVGTSRTPLLGQPSTAANYVDGQLVHHLGPSHFYLLAPFMRLLGAATGMLLVSVLITGSSVLVAAWAVFRQLGPVAGGVAAVVLGVTTFTTGASALANPVSSSISGYPLLCSAVLLWCVLCGDLRLLPLTAFWVSFTAQQHLAVLPALALMTAVAVGGCLVLERRQGRLLARWAAIAAGVGLLVWSPVVIQELFGATGNLSQMREFTGHSDRSKLGMSIAFDQLVHALGLPPLLGQTQLHGTWFFGTPTLSTTVTAALVVVVLVAAGVRWLRAGDRRRAGLVVMAAAAAVGGLLNSSSIPVGIEQYRLPFYHWAFVLTFFVTSSLVLLLGDFTPRFEARRQAAMPWLRTAVLPALGIALVVVPAAIDPTLERRTNTLLAAYAPVEKDTIEEMGRTVMESRDELDGPVVLVSRGEGGYVGLREAVALDLQVRGLDIRHPRGAQSFVHDNHLADRDTLQAGLVLVVDKKWQNDVAAANEIPGELLVDVDSRGEIDFAAFEALVAQGEAVDEVVLGPEVEKLVDDMATQDERTIVREHLRGFAGERARQQLSARANLEFLLDTPLAQPDYDPDLIRRVLETMPDDPLDAAADDPQWRLRIYRLDRDEFLDWDGREVF